FAGLGAAMIFAVYDYLGYYNIAYLGDEVKEPEKTIPRVIVISILAIAVIYIVMQACIISVLPYDTAPKSQFVVAGYIRMLAGETSAHRRALCHRGGRPLLPRARSAQPSNRLSSAALHAAARMASPSPKRSQNDQ